MAALLIGDRRADVARAVVAIGSHRGEAVGPHFFRGELIFDEEFARYVQHTRLAEAQAREVDAVAGFAAPQPGEVRRSAIDQACGGRELGDLAALATSDRDHFSVLGLGTAAGGALPWTTFDVGAATAPDSVVTLRLRFRSADHLAVTLNGEPLAASAPEDNWLTYPVNARALKAGNNELQLALVPSTKAKAAKP